jgi:hypothetical protein
MPVRSIITNPPNGAKLASGTQEVNCAAPPGPATHGRGGRYLDRLRTSWKPAKITPPRNQV